MKKVFAYVEATVWYTCELSEENSTRAISYAEENGCTLREAVEHLYNDINVENFCIYDECVESEFSTEGIEKAWIEEDDD